MNSAFIKKNIKTLVSLAILLALPNVATALDSEYKNSLTKVELKQTSSETCDVNLYLQKKTSVPVKVIKKSDLSYYILLPETKNASTSTQSGSDIRSVFTNSYKYAASDVNNGYTKISINTTKPINFNITVKSSSEASNSSAASAVKQTNQPVAAAAKVPTETQKPALVEKKNTDFQEKDKTAVKQAVTQPLVKVPQTKATQIALVPQAQTNKMPQAQTNKTPQTVNKLPQAAAKQLQAQTTKPVQVINTKTTAAQQKPADKPQVNLKPAKPVANQAAKQPLKQEIKQETKKEVKPVQKPAVKQTNPENIPGLIQNSTQQNTQKPAEQPKAEVKPEPKQEPIENIENDDFETFENAALDNFDSKDNLEEDTTYHQSYDFNSVSLLKDRIMYKIDEYGLSINDLLFMFFAGLFSIIALFFIFKRPKQAAAKLASKKDLINKLDKTETFVPKKTKVEVTSADTGKYFIFDKNIKQTAIVSPAESEPPKNYELTTYDPDLDLENNIKEQNDEQETEYDIIQKILKEDTSVELEPDEFPVKDEVESHKEQHKTTTTSSNSSAVVTSPIKQQQEQTELEKESKPINPNEPVVLSNVEIAPERGFMCISYNNNINLMGYIFDDVFAIYNFKASELDNYDIQFRLSDRDNKGSNYIIKVADTKVIARVTKSQMNLLTTM